MTRDDMLSTYQRIIRTRFASVCVIFDERFTNEYEVSLCALGIPDDRRAEFTLFILNELAPAVGAAGFEFAGIMPYSWPDAKEIFPEASSRIASQAFTEAIQVFTESTMAKATRGKWGRASSTEYDLLRTHRALEAKEPYSKRIISPREGGCDYMVVRLSNKPSESDGSSLGSAA